MHENNFKLKRLRLDPLDRLVTMGIVGSGVGAVCGGYLGGQLAGRQYLAERAHRLPTTVSGWYFYQKWKNYRVALGGMRGALRYGGRMGGCVLAYSAAEAALDQMAGRTQMLSSMAAGLVTAVGVSVIYRLPRSSVKRACMAGMGVGLVAGAMQDLVKELY